MNRIIQRKTISESSISRFLHSVTMSFRRMKRRLSNTRSLHISQSSQNQELSPTTTRQQGRPTSSNMTMSGLTRWRYAGTLIIAVGVSYLDDLSPKSIMGLLEAVRWKTTSPDFNPYAIGVVDSERPVNRSYLPCDNLQKMSIAWHRDATYESMTWDLSYAWFRCSTRAHSSYVTYWKHYIVRKILASNMEFKILSSVLNAPALPWESVHNIDLMDMIYQTPITSATYDHSRKISAHPIVRHRAIPGLKQAICATTILLRSAATR